MTDAWQSMDDWCRGQTERLRAIMDPHILAGRSLADPAYRQALGQSQALARMRSFIHGARTSGIAQPHSEDKK